MRPIARRRRSRPSGSPSSRRCSRTCWRACGDGRNARLGADELAERFHIPREELQEHLSLLNLVNFGGGCYTVYAELEGDTVRVDKELYGDVFRRAPRLTPLEARAIRLALDIVGPTIAARVHTPLDRVRHKLEETFGQFEDHQTPERREEGDEEELVATLSDAIEQRRVVAIEYLKEGEEMPSERLVEPYTFERVLPNWLIHTWDRTARRRALVPARPDALGAADRRDVRAARGLRSHDFLVDTRPVARPLREADRAVPDRARRGAADATARAIATLWIGHRRLADRRDPGRPRRGRRRSSPRTCGRRSPSARESSCASCG